MIDPDTLMLWRALTIACRDLASEQPFDATDRRSEEERINDLRKGFIANARDPRWMDDPNLFRLNRPVISPEMAKELTCPFPPELFNEHNPE
jgi:hypothetical protein